MGACNSVQTPEEMTATLWTLINKKLIEYHSASAAQGLIAGGAFIDRPGAGGKYMVEECREQEKRNRQANRSREADMCKRVAEMLESKASQGVVEACTKGDLAKVKLYGQKLGGDLFQGAGFGTLGLLSVALKSPHVSVPLVQFLVENHASNRRAVGAAITETNPPQPLHADPKLPRDVAEYLRRLLDQLLLELPATVEVGQGNQGQAATRLVEHAERLIQNGANPKATDAECNNVLCLAVIRGHVPLAKRLLGLGLDSTYTNPATGMSILQLAESQHHRDPVLVALLKSHSFNLQFQARIRSLGEEKEVEYETAKGELQELLTAGADIHCLDGNHDTPLALLVNAIVTGLDQEDEGQFVKLFVADFHADPERVNAQGLRAVELAILKDRNLRVLTELLHAGSALANPKSKESVLTFARRAPESPFKDAVVHLIQGFINEKLWATASKCNRRGKNHQGLNEEIRGLLNLGADINAQTGDEGHEGYTPLCLVAQQGDAYLFKALVETHKADPKIAAKGEGSFFNTPLHLSAQSGNLANVQFLRSLALDFNVLNARKESALHLAAASGHVRVVKYLVAWGCSPAHQNEEGHTALHVAEQAASAAGASSPRAGSGSKADSAQFPLVVAFLSRCEVAPVCNEKAHIISQVDPATIDVCPLVRLEVPANLVPAGASDEDPLGQVSRGAFKGSPNDCLKTAARKGALEDAKKAVSEGADVRHVFDGKSAWQWAIHMRDDARRKKEAATEWKRQYEYQSEAQACDRVADYLATVATTKCREAVEQGNEGRVASFHAVGANLDGLVHVAVASTPSVGIVHYLVIQSQSNHAGLWNRSPPPYSVAKGKKFDKAAAYIQAQLSLECAKAVSSNNLFHVRECVTAGGLPDVESQSNVVKAMEHKNVDMVRFLLDSGARLPNYQNVQQIEQDANLSVEMRALLRQRFVDRVLRINCALGNFAEVARVHALGGDLSAQNYAGATPLSMCLQYTHQPIIAHYLVSRGCSMLHKAQGVPTCVLLSRAPGHPPNNALESFLKQALNVALFSAVMEGDLTTAAALGALGADLASLDEAGNTLVHSAVLFQGVDAVRWLVERGAPLNVANSAGEYAITQAVMKGDFGSVEFIIHQNAGTKALKNASGKTALDLAKDMRFNKLVQLMDPGNKDFPVSGDDSDQPAEPSQEYEELIRAAQYGQMDAIKIFVEEKYASLQRKVQLAAEMIRVAESKSQAEVLRILVPHHRSLTSQAASDQTADRLVSASAEQKKILQGFLTGLSGLIAGGEVALDPSDPGTYQQLFANLTSKVGASTEFLAKASPADLSKAAVKESADLAAKMAKIESEMRAMVESRTAMQKRLAAQEAQLASCKTAVQKKECFKEMQEVKDQLNTLASSVQLFTRAAETAARKKKTLDTLKSQPSLLSCFSTIENRLQGLFLACKSATAGMMSLNMTEQGERRMQMVGLAADLSDMIPVIGATLSKVIGVGVGTLVKHMDKARQQQEISNIVTLGNIEELEKSATNAAALVTFYYSAQINAIDTNKESSGNKKAAESVQVLGEFLVLCMIKALQKGLVPGMDLAQQLWFAVASQDPLKPSSLVDRLLGTPGDTQVVLKDPSKPKVTLRALVGSVGVIDASNQLYVPPQKVLQEVTKVKPGFTPFYSVVYLSAFTSGQELGLILVRRGLVQAGPQEAKQFLASTAIMTDEQKAMLAASVAHFKEGEGDEGMEGSVVPVTPGYSRGEGSSSPGASSSPSGGFGGDMGRVSLQVHDVLAQKGLVVTRTEVQEMLQQHTAESSVAVETDVEALREDLNAKHALYQSSIEAATETLTTETEKLRAEHKAVGQELGNLLRKQMADQATLFAKKQAEQNALQEERLNEVLARADAHVAALKASSEKALADMQQQHAAAVAKMQAEASEALRAQAAAQADAMAKLVATSDAASKNAAAAQATATAASTAAATTLSQATQAKEAWALDLSASKQKYDAALKASTDASAKSVADYKASLDAFKAESKASAAAAKESANAAAATAKEAKESRELQAKELKQATELREKEIKLMKEQAASESKALVQQVKEAQSECAKAADAARSADKAARKAQSEAEEAREKVQKIEANMAKKA